MIFEFIIILSIIAVISAKNPVHSTLFLVLVFLNTAMKLISMGVDFLGIFIIIVYVGAIAILFLFVIMMLNIKLTEWGAEPPLKYLPIGFFFGLLFLFILSFFISSSPISTDSIFYQNSNHLINWNNELQIKGNNLVQLGILLYTSYLPYLMVATIILLVAMIGVIVLTFSKNSEQNAQNHYQSVYQQNSSYLNNHLFH